MTNEPGKSDRPVVPKKSPNNAGQPATEGMEGRGLAKGNLPQQNASRTPSRNDALSALERVRQAAKEDKKLRFTALLHHIYNLETLRMAYLSLKKEAAPGMDGETWRHYGETLEENLQDLSHRLKRGAYRAKPVRRVYIPKADGRQRPLGVTTLEDKIVQRATVEVLNAIYEADLKSNLYKIWNRMSSGTYFPPPVRAVSIPKKSGGQRIWVCPRGCEQSRFLLRPRFFLCRMSAVVCRPARRICC